MNWTTLELLFISPPRGKKIIRTASGEKKRKKRKRFFEKKSFFIEKQKLVLLQKNRCLFIFKFLHDIRFFFRAGKNILDPIYPDIVMDIARNIPSSTCFFLFFFFFSLVCFWKDSFLVSKIYFFFWDKFWKQRGIIKIREEHEKQWGY